MNVSELLAKSGFVPYSPDVYPVLREYFTAFPTGYHEYNAETLHAWHLRASYWIRSKGGVLSIYSDILRVLFCPLTLDLTLSQIAEASRESLDWGHSGRVHFVDPVLVETGGDSSYFSVVADRDNYDYLYRVRELVALEGARLKKKAVQIGRFLDVAPGHVLRSIKPGDWEACLSLLDMWADESGVDPADYRNERQAFVRSQELVAAGRLQGIIVEVDGAMVGLSLFGPQCPDMMVVHFEKALSAFPGAAQFVTWQVARACMAQGVQYLNRQEDLGIPGLRQAKLALGPSSLLPVCQLVPRQAQEAL
jgi:hypothetical protein